PVRVDKRPVETIKDGNEDCDRTDGHEIGKIGGNGHDMLLSMGCASTRPLRALKTLAILHSPIGRIAFEPCLDMASREAVPPVPCTLAWAPELGAKPLHDCLNLG